MGHYGRWWCSAGFVNGGGELKWMCHSNASISFWCVRMKRRNFFMSFMSSGCAWVCDEKMFSKHFAMSISNQQIISHLTNHLWLRGVFIAWLQTQSVIFKCLEFNYDELTCIHLAYSSSICVPLKNLNSDLTSG